MMLTLSEKIRSIPSFWPLIFFSGGILWEDKTRALFSTNFWFILLFIFGVFILLMIYLIDPRKNKITDLILIICFFQSGYIFSINDPPDFKTGEKYHLAEIISLPVQKQSSTHYLLKIIGNKNKLYSRQNTYLVNAYFSLKHSRPLPEPGDVILLEGEPEEILNTGNPYEFNYAGYLAIRDIYYTIFLEENDWRKTNLSPKTSGIIFFSLEIKKLLQEKIKNIARKKSGLDYEIMLAICTGDKSELDQDMKKAFSNAGAIHIMAVSGLHVGMIWVFLNSLSFFLRKRKAGKIIQFILILSVLWFYALLTGLSSSVIRSCSMFTIASLGVIMNRRSMIFNTVFIAAFLQIIFNPKIIYDAGFQFSYAAVLSILFFQPPMGKLLRSKNPLIQRILDLINVSLSAQFLTFPLAAYYFHQFPVYFLLSNLCIIPMVTILMVLFLSSVVVLFIPALSELLIYLSLILARLMRFTVEMINSLPGNVIKEIDVNLLQVFLILIIPLIFLGFYYYRRYYFLLLLTLFSSFAVLTGIIKQNLKDRPSVCVFNIRKGTAFNIRHHERNLLLYDEITDVKNIEYASSNYMLKRFSIKPEYISFQNLMFNDIPGLFYLKGRNNFIYETGYFTVVMINDHSFLNGYKSNSNYDVDLMILGGSSLPSFEELSRHFSMRNIVISSSIPWYIPDITIDDSISTVYHRVSEKGAFIIEL